MPTDCQQSLFQQVSPAPDCQSVCKSLDHALARAECFGLLTPLSRQRIGINARRRYRTCGEAGSMGSKKGCSVSSRIKGSTGKILMHLSRLSSAGLDAINLIPHAGLVIRFQFKIFVKVSFCLGIPAENQEQQSSQPVSQSSIGSQFNHFRVVRNCSPVITAVASRRAIEGCLALCKRSKYPAPS